MGRPKKIESTSALVDNDIANVPVESTLTSAVQKDATIPPAILTYKQELEILHKEMLKHGIHSIGQLEVKISQQK